MKAKLNMPYDIVCLIALMDNNTIYNQVEKRLNKAYEYRNGRFFYDRSKRKARVIESNINLNWFLCCLMLFDW